MYLQCELAKPLEVGCQKYIVSGICCGANSNDLNRDSSWDNLPRWSMSISVTTLLDLSEAQPTEYSKKLQSLNP